MNRRLTMAVELAFLLMTTLGLSGPLPDDSLALKLNQERRETEEWLKSSPTSYLATIAREDFGGRTSLSVGRGEDNDLQIEDTSLAVHHLRVTVVGDSFRVETLDAGASFKWGKESMTAATVPPGRISAGRFLMRLSHQRFPAIIVYDPASPRFSEYKGLKYFPFRPEFRFVIPLERAEHPDTVVILSTRGNRRSGLRVGWFVFRVGDEECRLEATRLLEPGVGENDYSIFFRDMTCGKESYPMGRYVEVEERPDGLFVLDFNNAYNPACAFSDHYNCPLPPEANHLKVPITAGEMDAHYLDH